MGSPGWKAVVKRSGTSTAFTDEAMTLVSGNTFQITDTAKRVWDRSVTPTFEEDDGAGGRQAIPASDVESVDYLFGKVTFARAVTEPVIVSGNYLPMQAVAGANAYNLNHTGDLLDDTDFEGAQANGGYRTRLYGLRDVSASITRWDDLSKMFADIIKNRSVVVIEIRPGGGPDVFRAFMVAESVNESGDVAALESEEISFQLDGEGVGKAFSWDTES